ncbi:MAG: acylphosphatase [Lysobacterales bacterium]|jgi:acylphosphatase|nr:MAG: acylphosphatase [Xanthomonadales bacterium]
MRRRFIVRGRVQGVFFRAATVEQARALGLEGYARNLPDGTVEVEAEGTETALESLLRWLWRGPPLARVEAVEEVPCGEEPLPLPFEIRR